jgi:6-pyruvoyltetrahydropterin/6-carboxytetrahydropterin synthase
MKAYLSRRYRFSASHRLHVASLTDEVNRETFGKCNNPHGHGHNYVVQVTYSGPIDAETGMVANLADLDRFAQERVLARFDHTNLNTLDLFADSVPTTENFAIALQQIFKEFTAARLESVHVEETSNNSFDFAGEALPAAGRY